MGHEPLQSQGWEPAGGRAAGSEPAGGGRASGGPASPPLPASSRWPTGVVRALKERTEKSQFGMGSQPDPVNVVTFRIERFDAAGSQLTPVPVEMRGKTFRGALHDGDWVRVRAHWQPGRNLRVKEVENLTTHSRFRVKRRSVGAVIVVLIAVVLVLVVCVTGGILFLGELGTSEPWND